MATTAADLMRAEGIPEIAIRSFSYHYDRLVQGRSSTLSASDIAPVESLPSLDDLVAAREIGRRGLSTVVVIKLNGGLGTSMGLDRAKSLLQVKEGSSFLDLIARQTVALRRRSSSPIPLLLMNSFSTDHDSLELLASYPALAEQGLPLSFLQHRIPKILADSLEPATSVERSDLAWCPPGHGDLYPALASSGLLDRLVGDGFRYAFVSNADNLGAALDTGLLGHMIASGLDFLMEVALRSRADRKGGHLCRLRESHRLALRESAQCPASERDAFQDIDLYRHFNTNNIWIDLRSLVRALEEHRGVLPLASIVNRKPLDPRNPASPAVIQLETAMGAAISLFDNAGAVVVPRERFSPVKTTDDLLAVRSDAFVVTADARVVLHPSRKVPPTVHLDPRYYGHIDELESRFPRGFPSLLHCDVLKIEGDVTFGESVTCRGETHVVATFPATIPANSVVEGKVRLQ